MHRDTLEFLILVFVAAFMAVVASSSVTYFLDMAEVHSHPDGVHHCISEELPE